MMNYIEEKVTEDKLWLEIEKIIRKNEELYLLEVEKEKRNFQDEIAEMEDRIRFFNKVSMYEDVIIGLKDDLEKEIKNIKAKYDEKKKKEIEETKTKFQSLCF